MMASWYVEKEGCLLGPFTGTQLKELAATGRLEPGDLVRRDDRSKAVPAGKVRGLFPEPDPEPVPGGPPPPPHSAEADGPPPLPPGDSRPDRIGEWLKNVTSASKAAARLTAALARKAHLEKVVLPAAFGALGRVIYDFDQFRDEFPDLYAEIGEAGRRIERLTSARPQPSQATRLADRAKHAATVASEKAQAKALSLKRESLLRRLGVACYERNGDGCGPESLVRPIIDGLANRGSIEEEIDRLSKIGEGRWVTPKRILIGSLGLIIFWAVVVARNPTSPGDRGGVQDTPAGASLGASPAGPANWAGIHTTSGKPTDGMTAGAMMPVIEAPAATIKSEYQVGRLSFSPDGKLLAVNDELWDHPSRRRLTQGDGGPQFGAAISFSSDGNYLACVNRSAERGTQDAFAELRIFRGGAGGVELARKHRIGTKLSDGFWHTTLWSPRSNYLAVVSGEVLVVISDPTGNPREEMIVHPSLLGGDVNGLGRLVGGFATHVAGLAFSPDEASLAVAFHQKGVHVFGLPGFERIAALPFPGSDGDWEWSLGLNKATVGYSPDGRFLVTKQEREGGRDETDKWINSSTSLVVWDTTRWDAIRTIGGSQEADRMVAQGFVGLLPEGRRGLIYPDEGDPRLLLWNATSGEQVESFRPPLIPRRTTDIAWNRDGSRVILTQVQGPIEVWDVDLKKPIAHIRDELAEHRRASAISPDGRLIATGYPNGEVALWDAGVPSRPESLGDLAAEAGQIRHQDDRQMELKKARPAFRSSDVSIDQFLTMVGQSGEVKNPRKGLPILVASKYELRAALGEPTNVLSSERDRKGTHEVLDYSCSDGGVLLTVTYDMAGAWIEEVVPRRIR